MVRYIACFTILVVWLFVVPTDAWQGHYETYLVRRERLNSYCICWYWWWGCSYFRHYWETYYTYEYRCSAGWFHNGDQNCNRPICSPDCANGGTCTSPNQCSCPSTSQGPYCRKLTCSYARPCYPGECLDDVSCRCSEGFSLNSTSNGCTNFIESEKRLQPQIVQSNVSIKNIRRFDNRINFMFVLEILDVNSSLVWSNQREFNNLKFEMKALFDGIDNLPNRPNYVHENKIGIVQNIITANVSKIPRRGSVRDSGSFKEYACQGVARNSPKEESATCVIDDDQFVTLIEHGDWLTVQFRSTSGGFQELRNTDRQSEPYATKYYNGLSVIKTVEFRFDFIAPIHCSEDDKRTCPTNDTILDIPDVYTKNPIRPRWLGWTDELSGVGEYYMEVFKLGPNRDERLVETTPLNPEFFATIPHTNGTIQYPEYRPSAPGMYSVLLEVRDFSNNSRIARRFVLYDATSSISLNNKTAKLYVSSAVEETGYTWQTPAATGNQVTVSVAWPNYFVNHVHEDGLFLGEIEHYPIQFKEIQDDGVLFSQKYVADVLDDNVEPRTRKAISNFHGIVKYEIFWGSTVDTREPTSGWEIIPLKESFTATRILADGDTLRVWIRATDIIGNTKADSTVVTIDGTPPILQTNHPGKDYGLKRNIADGPYNFSSKITFAASDSSSGVHKIGFKAIVKTQSGETKAMYSNFTAANMQEDLSSAFCKIVDRVCFLPDQTLYLDNCWLTVTKSDLDTATAMMEVTVYNQAMLYTSTMFDIGPINNLQGLEKYNGPQNLRVVNKTPTGFRIEWDLPSRESCYGRADIVIILSRKNSNGQEVLHTFYTPGTSMFFDILGLTPETEYTLGLNIQSQGGSAQKTDLAVTARTEKQESGGVSIGGIIGAVIGVLAVVAIVVFVMVILIRRGVIRPAERAREVGRRISRRVRQSRMFGGETHSNPSYSEQRAGSMAAEELYLYGGMDTYASKSVLSRKDIVFESVIKSGHFANIYKAKYQGKTVVAKTLKENYATNDEFLMKAKINFSSEKVGDHPNVLKYLGSVLDDTNMGPFILYEYCENGTLKEYLAQHKSNVTMEIQETLFRIGLDIAKGMEYLAGKGITHRRLAARNILMTFLNEVKIYGFGPQPEEEGDGDAESGKKERIPIKWMAPECMSSTKNADEKSDVWSFGVVLWEVFTLGESPYENVRSRDLPDRLKKNVRLHKPEHCDDVWYGVMTKCWAFQSKKRPTFADIRTELDTVFVASPGDDYYYYKR
ncbi:uncharacterized protein LOC127855047 [Dreissena polymorpha]|uniref:uncharacterized protein LOC127855047 n=1 Tax=Dreissena polymorpha TaxID=45954 RepID=UPI002264E4E4|nr:uncharacterized protein LOC127855047 [Dreissena polymorpha]